MATETNARFELVRTENGEEDRNWLRGNRETRDTNWLTLEMEKRIKVLGCVATDTNARFELVRTSKVKETLLVENYEVRVRMCVRTCV